MLPNTHIRSEVKVNLNCILVSNHGFCTYNIDLYLLVHIYILWVCIFCIHCMQIMCDLDNCNTRITLFPLRLKTYKRLFPLQHFVVFILIPEEEYAGGSGLGSQEFHGTLGLLLQGRTGRWIEREILGGPLSMETTAL